MLLKGGYLLRLSPSGLVKADIRIDGDRIVARGARLKPRAGEVVEDCAGKLILPGLVCAHTHMYSTLARGMPAPRTAPRSFPDILGRVWWKLDQALDQESIYYSALVGAIEAVRCGTTTVFDHHASPNAIPGSLDIIRAAFRAVGVRGVLCYEVTDRGGARRRDAGLAENDRFIAATADDTMFRGLVGAHASFTLSDRTLAALGDLARSRRAGVHVHVAEAPDDGARTAAEHGCGILDRFERFGILDERALLVHGVHLSARDLERVRRANAWLVHNPRSNMNNGVGHAPAHEFGPRAALGTDGWPVDMLDEARLAHFRMRERLGPSGSFDMAAVLDGGQRLAEAVFRRPFGALDKGSVADLVVCGYLPPTPIDSRNAVWHTLFGLRTSMIERVMAGGRWVFADGRIPGLDLQDVFRHARCEAAGIWERMHG
ncbi:MAG: amidohydrolase family protein [Vicinamibacterales bacterium]|nr:amidohydrolase family protein [Vicinamibacterales bacterium]